MIEDRGGQVWMQSSSGLAVWPGENDGQLRDVVLDDISEPRLLAIDGSGVIWVSGKDVSGATVIAAYGDDHWTFHDH